MPQYEDYVTDVKTKPAHDLVQREFQEPGLVLADIPKGMRLVDDEEVLDLRDLECLRIELRHSRKAIANMHGIIEGYRHEAREAREETLSSKAFEKESRLVVSLNMASQMRQIVVDRLSSAREQYRDLANQSRSKKLKPKTDKEKLAHKDKQIELLLTSIILTVDAVNLYTHRFVKEMEDLETARLKVESVAKNPAPEDPQTFGVLDESTGQILFGAEVKGG